MSFEFRYGLAVNPGRILSVFSAKEVDCLLIGGMNFFLRHRPVTTFDVDFWVCDEEANLVRVTQALSELGAECEYPNGTWGPVPLATAWMRRLPVHCLTSQAGAIDVFRFVQGLDSYEVCKDRSALGQTKEGISYRSLSDADMLTCQLALPEGSRRLDRVAYLQEILAS